MPAHRLEVDPALFRAAYEASGGIVDLCRRLELTYNQSAIRRFCAESDLPYPAPHWTRSIQRADTRPPEVEPAEQVEADKAEARIAAELSDLKRKYAVALKSSNLHDDILEVAREVMGKVTPTKVCPPKIGSGKTTEDAILGWADWQGGEVVDRDVMLGYNAYDPVIMARRAQYTVDHTLEILFGIHIGTTFERLWVFDLGDSINGDLLDEAKATNALPVFESMRMVAKMRAVALTELASYIPVSYVAVPGNHGRRSPKMAWKQPTETADWLIAEMIGDLTAGNERVSVASPKAWTVGVTVRGWNHSLNHGYSAAKGGYGGIPWYAFQRTDGKLTALEAAHGKRVHYRWYGHVHQKAELPMMDGEGDQFIIGSLMGGDEFALGGLSAYADPVQKLVGCHEKHGATWRYPLDVKHADETPSRYEELL